MITVKTNIPSIISAALARINQIKPGGAVYDKALSEAATTQLTASVQRIHTDGQASDGSDIGQYSTNPLYVNPANSPSPFQAIGKTGKTIFARSGQAHLSRYFDQGYSGYRQDIGLPADRVVLSLRGDLRDGLSVIKTDRGCGLGWTDDTLYQIALSLERRYGKKIWSPTEQERGAMVSVVKERL